MNIDIEKERADFEAACRQHAKDAGYDDSERLERDGDGYADPATQAAWWGWREGRTALQSQDREDTERLDFLSRADIMGCSLVSDDDGRWAFSDSGVAPVPPEGGFTGDVSIVSWVKADMWKESPREAIDHARRIGGYGE